VASITLKKFMHAIPLLGWHALALLTPVCSYCGREVPVDWRTPDHIHPYSQGGRSVNNITMACPSCNMKKGNHSLLKFLITIGGIR
jgi:5-methylcytosine-specific restriction endonuclease McrA